MSRGVFISDIVEGNEIFKRDTANGSLKCFSITAEYEKRSGSFFNRKWTTQTKTFVHCDYSDEIPEYELAGDNIRNLRMFKPVPFGINDYIKYGKGYDADRELLFEKLYFIDQIKKSMNNS
jgi:hypothetical protein